MALLSIHRQCIRLAPSLTSCISAFGEHSNAGSQLNNKVKGRAPNLVQFRRNTPALGDKVAFSLVDLDISYVGIAPHIQNVNVTTMVRGKDAHEVTTDSRATRVAAAHSHTAKLTNVDCEK